jgi:hypothetical protein
MSSALAYKPKVYTASKIWHAPFWRARAVDRTWDHVDFTARWIYMEHLEKPDAFPTPAQFGHFWAIDKQDVLRSDFVICLAFDPAVHPIPDHDHLKGGLIEAGMGIAAGKTVLAIGFHHAPKSHSWTWGPQVVRLETLEDARLFLKGYRL